MSSNSRPRKTAWIAATVAGAVVWCGCSIERDYEILSFFFDGVPEPGSADAAAGAGGGAGAGGALFAGGMVSGHTAYRERRCAWCHGDAAQYGFQTIGFSSLSETVCLDCHTDSLEHTYLHGPVAVGACLFCHEPHVSRFPSLLVDESPELCLACHQFEFEGQPVSEVHADPTRDCLECHTGHGGDHHYFLRPGPADPDS
ncbi:MAG: cytochrome c3 family protein [Planctomycetota bacterium]